MMMNFVRLVNQKKKQVGKEHCYYYSVAVVVAVPSIKVVAADDEIVTVFDALDSG